MAHPCYNPHMEFTAQTFYAIHHAAINGIFGAMGTPLPPLLDDVKLPAARMAHYAMALVLARHTSAPDPVPPAGMNDTERALVVKRLTDHGLLPAPAPAP